MTIRTRAEIKAFFETDDLPTQEEFADLIDSTRFPGDAPEVILSDSDGAANNATLQALLTAGTPIALPKGRWPVTGSLSYPHNTAIWGHGSDYCLLFDGTSDGFVPADLTNGAVSCLFDNFHIEGGWTRDWSVDPSTSTIKGLYVLSELGTVVNNMSNSSARLGDNYSRITNMHITRFGGDGLVIEGRGEIIVAGNNIQNVLKRGIDCTAYDMWFWGNSVSLTGQEALWLGRPFGTTTNQQSGTSGNIRAFGNKYWFVGMSTFSAPLAAVVMDNDNHGDCVWDCESIQDTQGPALNITGQNVKWTGTIDNSHRLNPLFGHGIAHDATLNVINLADLFDGNITVAIQDRAWGNGVNANLALRPLYIGDNSTRNAVTLNLIQKRSQTPFWDTTRVVERGASEDGTNLVSDPRGKILFAGLGCPGLTTIWLTASDETSDITVGTKKVSLPMREGFKALGLEAELTGDAPTGSSFIADVMLDGVSVMDDIRDENQNIIQAARKLEIDAGETSTLTASTPPAITNDEAASGELLQVDVTQVGSTVSGSGLKVAVIGYPL